MSSPIHPTTDPARPAAQPLSRPLSAELARDEQASPIELSRAAPPQEVLDQMMQADAIGQLLRERDRELSFCLSPQNRLLGIELRDSAGNRLRSVSATEASAIAVGKPVE